MAADASFDVVSEFDRQELINAIDQAEREILTRYDLKDSKTEIKLEKDSITVSTATDMTLNAIRDLLQSKLIRRNLSLKILEFGDIESATGGTVRQTAILKQGIGQDLAKTISKEIRETVPKAKTQIQGDSLRVTGKSRDELQEVISFLKAKEYPVPLQFTNYR